MNYARKLRSQEVIYLVLSCYVFIGLTILDSCIVVYFKIVIVIIFACLSFF
jgi:hypothetical protein